MDYQDYVKIQECTLPTGIHTRVNEEIRISSAYRRYANPHFESWGWETIVWKNENVEYVYDPVNSPEQVVNLHIEILNEFL